MPARILKTKAVLSGIVDVETAEPLHHKLCGVPNFKVEFKDLEHLHAAVLQVLLAHQVPLPGQLLSPPSFTQPI